MAPLLRPLILLGAAGALTALAGAAPPYPYGPPTAVASNRPYYGNCTICHSGTVNGGAGSVTISGVPTVYAPGATYPITVTVSDALARRWGFEMIALRTNAAMGGDFTITDAVNTQIAAAGTLEYAQQTDTGSYQGLAGPRSWTLDWTAPPASAGDIAFTASGNAANNNSFYTGDKVYNTAVMSAAPDGSVPEAMLAAQPNLTNPRRGQTWTVNGRITNTLPNAATYTMVSRIRLPNGSYYPPSGWLGGPTSVSVPAGGTNYVRFNHPIPGGAPLVSATYEMYLRNAGGALVYQDSFAFTVSP